MEDLFETTSTAATEPGGRIMIIDDDPFASEMLAIGLDAAGHEITIVNSGEEALTILADAENALQPDVIFLDIEMPPGIDGYETCRQLRTLPATGDLPVIFLSGHDDLESRLRAYDAGGSDFLAKPSNREEVLYKAALSIRHKRRYETSASEQRTYFSTAMTAITTLGESGVTLAFSRKALGCHTLRALASTTIESMTSFGLECHVQLRTPSETLTHTPKGVASPLECSVIEKMRSMGRIFSFKNRSIINYDSISILITNMPIADQELSGRIRDHVAMIAEAANLAVDNVNLRAESVKNAKELRVLADDSRAAVEELRSTYRELQLASRLELENMTNTIEGMFVHLGLTENQEFTISDTVRGSVVHVLGLFERSRELDQSFTRIVDGLTKAGEYTVSQEDETPLTLELW